MKFEKYNISQEIKNNLNAIGFLRTTDIQFKTIPAIMNGEDVLAIAQTGTGKTAAFAIPIINQIHEQKHAQRNKGITCLVMVPTRELAKQIGQVFSQLSKNTKATSYAIYGGVEQDPQIEQLTGGVDILIATPGRMFDLISQEYIDVSHVKVIVLDEADHMLDLGFIEDIKSIKHKLKQRHQTLFFSATINPVIKKLAYSQIKSSALRIQVSPENLVSKNITHYITKIALDDKRHLLVDFLNANPESKVIAFTRTQVRAERVLSHLIKNNIEAVNIHGGMPQTEREKSLEDFRNKKQGVLIATDISARGIDLPGITHVINYDLPDAPENYVHRVGRTGRGFAKGDAISFCCPEEDQKLSLIESLIQTTIPVIDLQGKLQDNLSQVDLESMDVSDIIAHEESRFEKPRKLKRKK